MKPTQLQKMEGAMMDPAVMCFRAQETPGDRPMGSFGLWFLTACGLVRQGSSMLFTNADVAGCPACRTLVRGHSNTGLEWSNPDGSP